MKIVVTGTRGIPGIQGGVETHCEELYPRIVSQGHDVTVIRRSCYVSDSNRIKEYKGVKLIDVYAPKRKSIEAILHTFLAVIRARSLNPDVLHIHAIGPSIMVPFARMLGMKVVTTHHGPDYERGKWGKLAKTVLKLGERAGARFSNRIIVISKVIARLIADKYGRTDTCLIFNGVPEAKYSGSESYLKHLGVDSHKYILAVGRFVPEKNFHQLIDAFKRSHVSDDGYKLVIAGDADHEDDYSLSLKRKAESAGVVLTGFIKGEPLQQLLSNARLFVLPSSHEGLPISLLEAMSYGNDVLVSDIPANMLAELDSDDFFRVGDIDALATAIRRKMELPVSGRRTYDLSNYNWDNIAVQTIKVYESVLK